MASKKPGKLTPEQERFVEEYLIDLNGTAAYLRAFPSVKRTTAATESSKLLRKPNIAASIKLARRDISRTCRTSAAKEVRGLAMLANYDIGAAFDLSTDDWIPLPPRLIPHEVRQAITGVKITRRRVKSPNAEDRVYIENVEYKFADKIAARDKLMRHLGLYKNLDPLEVLIAALPSDKAAAVRAALAAAVHPGGDSGGTGPGPGAAGDDRQPD